jgi:hypothetical protein
MNAELVIEILPVFLNGLDGAMNCLCNPAVVVARSYQAKNLQLTPSEMRRFEGRVAFAGRCLSRPPSHCVARPARG